MSTSNNLDEKPLLRYICNTFRAWKINHINEDCLIDAKKNNGRAIEPLKRLLFDLSILHIFNYEYNI